MVVADADEVINNEILRYLPASYDSFAEPIYLSMQIFYYHLNAWLHLDQNTPYPWQLVYVITDRVLQSKKYGWTLSRIRTTRVSSKIILEAGLVF